MQWLLLGFVVSIVAGTLTLYVPHNTDTVTAFYIGGFLGAAATGIFINMLDRK